MAFFSNTLPAMKTKRPGGRKQKVMNDLWKTAAFQEGFIRAAKTAGLTEGQAVDMYKQAFLGNDSTIGNLLEQTGVKDIYRGIGNAAGKVKETFIDTPADYYGDKMTGLFTDPNQPLNDAKADAMHEVLNMRNMLNKQLAARQSAQPAPQGGGNGGLLAGILGGAGLGLGAGAYMASKPSKEKEERPQQQPYPQQQMSYLPPELQVT